MYRKWITAVVVLVGMTASAQTKEKEEIEKSADVKTKKSTTTITIDDGRIIINGKNIKDMSPEELNAFKGSSVFIDGPVMRKMFPGKLGDDVFKFDRDAVMGNEAPRAFLGVMSEKNEKGAKITSVTKESAASKAGLEEGDIITKVNDASITGSEDLFETIRKFKPEDKVTITYLRDGQEKKTDATLGKTMEIDFKFNFGDNFNNNRNFDFDMPNLRGLDKLDFGEFNFRKPRLGMEIQDTENSKGVKVTEISEETPAEKAGIKKDDIITEINGKAVNSVDEIKLALKDLKEGDVVKAGILRAGKTQTIDIKIPKKLKTADL